MEIKWDIKDEHYQIIINLIDTKTDKFVNWDYIKKNYSNDKFIGSFINLLTTLNTFDSYYIEFSPTIFNSLDHVTFQFVLTKTGGFSSTPDIHTFGIEKLNTNTDDIIWFPNPSNTALLVVPCYNQSFPMDDYIHIGKFMKSSNIKQKQNLVIKIFELYFEMLEQNQTKKLWLSTHGKGVAWLHVRIDTIPRYITHINYK